MLSPSINSQASPRSAPDQSRRSATGQSTGNCTGTNVGLRDRGEDSAAIRNLATVSLTVIADMTVLTMMVTVMKGNSGTGPLLLMQRRQTGMVSGIEKGLTGTETGAGGIGRTGRNMAATTKAAISHRGRARSMNAADLQEYMTQRGKDLVTENSVDIDGCGSFIAPLVCWCPWGAFSELSSPCTVSLGKIGANGAGNRAFLQPMGYK